ncbi:MAG: translation initiation factor IF-3 [Caldiserica bacterium]|nr:MAG: translation initiation factor IF-3 [Caldisericota bacterium]
MKNKKKFYRRNYQIRVPKVRVVDEDGKQIGIMDTREALKIAESKNLDLVEVAPNVNPPVCRIMDFSKFIYSIQKKEKEARRHKRLSQMKEVRLRPKTSLHDIDIKLKKVGEFIEEGHKVKISIFFRGREKEFKDEGYSKMNYIIEKVKDKVKIERGPKMEGSRLIVILVKK